MVMLFLKNIMINHTYHDFDMPINYETGWGS